MEARGLKTPLLIGGATTSKMHTAVKIEPQYSGPAIYVLDASKAVPVCQALMDDKQREEYCEDVRETYRQLRGRYPNRGYPKIFKDETVGAEAKKLFDEAQVMLKRLIDERKLTVKGVVGIFPACRVGEDVQ